MERSPLAALISPNVEPPNDVFGLFVRPEAFQGGLDICGRT
jgi:hypothetical protein